MESLTALGLAANIIQFVEFSARLLSEASEVYHSTTGLSKDQVELQDVAESLKNMTESLVAPTNYGLSPAQLEINKIALSAKVVAEDLITAVQRLKVTEGSKKRWRSFRQALSTLWNKDKIENLQKRLDALRSQLSVQILAHVSTLQNDLVADFQELKARCEDMNLLRKASVKQIMDSVRDVKRTIEDLSKDSLEKLEEKLKEARGTFETYDKERQILQSLQFETMKFRFHAIAEAHHRTFHWIFEPEHFPPFDVRSKITFKYWLTSGTGIYWISGKPGSGKSTLMKHICESSQTESCLQRWAQSDRLATAAFYFWTSGSEMQRSQQGLLQQLLFEILRACPDTIPTLCSTRWARGSFVDWSVPELRATFSKLGESTCDTKICLFIDGLDEYDGDHLELISILQSISNIHNVKLCVSSRPLPAFEDAFGHHADYKLYLEHLTVDDISRFARDKLEEIPGFAILRQERLIYSELVSNITRKAEGVFLWVFLVVRSLREGLINGDSLPLLRQRLDEIPSDLETFFDNLIKSVDIVYKFQMAVAFDVAIRTPEPLSMLTYWFLDDNNIHSQDLASPSEYPDAESIETQMIRKLNGCYKGLLEGTGVPGSRKVNFIHRTVRDYLRMRTVQRLFSQSNLESSTRALKAFAAQAAYCTPSSRANYLSPTIFIIFARWAEQESHHFDWKLVDDMNSWTLSWFKNYEARFILAATRAGFISYLEHRRCQDSNFILAYETRLLHAALDTQVDGVNAIFGLQSSYATLAWLLKNGANPNHGAADGTGTLFLQYLAENGAYARRSQTPWAYEQWETSLSILLQHGADFDAPFRDARFIKELPYLGFIKDVDNLDAIVLNDSAASVRKSLHRHLNTYAAFFEHGLDPNRSVGAFTLWGIWLWYMCLWQSDHGYLEEICVRAVKLFLLHGADPRLVIEFTSDRIGSLTWPRWTVAAIVERFFTREAQAELVPALQSAMRRWRQSHAS